MHDLLENIQGRGSKSASSLTLAYLSKFFNWCVDRDIDRGRPDQSDSTDSLRSRERVLIESELALVWQAFEEEGGVFGPLFKVLLLTGQRGRGRWHEMG